MVPGVISSSSPKRELSIIALLVVCAVGIRLYQIQAPILEHSAWRQAIDALMAEHYYTHGYSKLLEPKVRGSASGPQPSINEFPLYPYVISLLYSVSGPTPVWGRVLSVLATALGLIWMYQLVLSVDKRRSVALCSALFLNFAPLMVFYGRAHQRHVLVLCLIIGCLREYVIYLSNQRKGAFLRCGLFGSLAILMNPPAAYVGIPMLFLAAREHSGNALRRVDLWLLAAVLLLPGVAWYAYVLLLGGSNSILPMGRPYLHDFGNPAYYVRWMSADFFGELFERVYKQVLTLAPLILFFLGAGSFRKENRLPFVWLLAVFFYFALDPWPVAIFVHEYYYLNTIPPLAWLAGRGFERTWSWLTGRFPKRARLTCAFLIAILIASYVYRIEKYADWFQPYAPFVKMLEIIDQRTAPGSIVVVDTLDDAITLNAERPTYEAAAVTVQVIEGLSSIAPPGAKPTHFLLTRDFYRHKGPDALREFDEIYSIGYSDNDFVLYLLSGAPSDSSGESSIGTTKEL